MTDRITVKRHLEPMVARLNHLTGNPLTPWTRNGNGTITANIGNYHLSQAYGGCQVQQMLGEGGGVTCPLTSGHVPKRVCYDTLHAFIRGIEECKHQHKCA